MQVATGQVSVTLKNTGASPCAGTSKLLQFISFKNGTKHPVDKFESRNERFRRLQVDKSIEKYLAWQRD